MSYAGARILVLGATGFIGRHVAEALVAGNADVVISGRSSTALSDLTATIKAEHFTCDVTRANDVAELLRDVRPQFVFNLAGYGVHPSQRDPALAQRVNAELPAQLAELVAGIPDARLIHTGSALEYGMAGGDLNESTPCTPTTLYGQTKLAGTRALQGNAVTARLFTVYGPGEPSGRLLPALIQTARTRETLPLTAGEQRRDFTYVGDVVEGLLRLGMANTNAGEVINLATGQLETVRGFVERAARVLGIEEELLQFGALPTRAEEMAHEPVSVRRLRELTSWVPATSIEEGVRKTAAG